MNHPPCPLMLLKRILDKKLHTHYKIVKKYQKTASEHTDEVSGFFGKPQKKGGLNSLMFGKSDPTAL